MAVTRQMRAKVDIIEKCHSIGHFGAQRTWELTKLVNDKITLSEVQDYIAQCKTCVEGPQSVPKSPLGVTVTASTPWEILHCDFVVPLPRSKSAFEYTFTLMVDLTRFVIAWPLRAATVYTTITILDKLFSILGPPRVLHSDNGSVFTAKDFASFCERWSVKQSFTPIVRPQANPVERSYRTLKSSLPQETIGIPYFRKLFSLIIPYQTEQHGFHHFMHYMVVRVLCHSFFWIQRRI
nr:uncharacterized protein K02A2.6-like [Crassostrea gigas]